MPTTTLARHVLLNGLVLLAGAAIWLHPILTMTAIFEIGVASLHIWWSVVRTIYLATAVALGFLGWKQGSLLKVCACLIMLGAPLAALAIESLKFESFLH